MSYQQSAIDYLWQKARSEQAKSLASLKLLLDHPARLLTSISFDRFLEYAAEKKNKKTQKKKIQIENLEL